MTELIAFLAGIIVGVFVAVPWQPMIRRRVRSKDIEALRADLHRAIAELEAQSHRRIDYEAGVDRGAGYGVRSGLG